MDFPLTFKKNQNITRPLSRYFPDRREQREMVSIGVTVFQALCRPVQYLNGKSPAGYFNDWRMVKKF